MKKSAVTNMVWKSKVRLCLDQPHYTVSPRGMEVRELQPGSYTVPMPAYLDIKSRKVNVPFMFAEAAWIISGSNRLEDLTPYMPIYEKFSDDKVFLRGAYGPKVVDQLGYVVDTLEADQDSRQAVLTIWRERPGKSKDIPCTTMMQFFIREGKLNMVTTMRSQDIVLGYTYDVFTFSMVAKAVQLLLAERDIEVALGDLTVTAGSLHLYSNHYEKAEHIWLPDNDRDETILPAIEAIETSKTYSQLITNLWLNAREEQDARKKL